MPFPSISIDNSGSFPNELSQRITGSVDGVAVGSPIYLYDNGSETPIGSAIVAPDHSWSAAIVLTEPDNQIVAQTPYGSGCLRSNSIELAFEPVLSPPSSGQGNPLDPASIVRVGSAHHLQAQAGPEVFVFGHHPGHVRLSGFDPAGPDHDRLRLPASAFSSIADVLHHIHGVGQSAVLTLDPHNTIAFSDITAHALKSHADAFRLAV